MPQTSARFASPQVKAVRPSSFLYVDDAWAEGTESFTLTLSHPTGASLGAVTSATINITDNDASTGASNPVDQTALLRKLSQSKGRLRTAIN
jgi:hypothetical protein